MREALRKIKESYPAHSTQANVGSLFDNLQIVASKDKAEVAQW